MTDTSFSRAQDAANTAYDMTLQQTGDPSAAADDYRSVMSAYAAAQRKGDYISHPAAIMWPDDERGAGMAGNSADEYDSSTEGPW